MFAPEYVEYQMQVERELALFASDSVLVSSLVIRHSARHNNGQLSTFSVHSSRSPQKQMSQRPIRRPLRTRPTLPSFPTTPQCPTAMPRTRSRDPPISILNSTSAKNIQRRIWPHAQRKWPRPCMRLKHWNPSRKAQSITLSHGSIRTSTLRLLLFHPESPQ